jgi:hypothetical protein
MMPAAVPEAKVGEFDRFTSAAWAANAFANPKSNTFTVPSGVSLMFGGLEVAMDDASFVRCARPSRSASQSAMLHRD